MACSVWDNESVGVGLQSNNNNTDTLSILKISIQTFRFAKKEEPTVVPTFYF